MKSVFVRFKNNTCFIEILKTIGLVAIVFGLLIGSGQAEPPAARYQVVKGAFCDTVTGKPFLPRGFNYIRLHQGHGTFDPEFYDPEAVETMFQRLSKDGFNTVRVFINGNARQKGAVASMEKPGLFPDYVAKVADFLHRANTNHVAVVLSMDFFPHVTPYVESLKPLPPEIHPANASVLEPGHVEAKASYLKSFIEALRSADPTCLDAVLAYDLQNELCYAVVPPFTLTEGKVRTSDGRVYMLPAQRQELADDAAVLCINTLADAVHESHPHAPIWASIFTFQAVGKPGPNHFTVEEAGWKNRVPFRPSAIVRSKADVLDIHFYCPNQQAFDDDLRSIEFDAVRYEADKKGMVLVAGEFGAFKSQFDSANAAAPWISELTSLLQRQGIEGWLYWTYDTFEQDSELWHAGAADGVIYQKLRREEP